MTLSPAQVHPQQHLGPIGGLGAAGAGADGHDGVDPVVLAREQQARAQRLVVLLQGRVLLLDAGLEPRVRVRELDQLGEVARPRLQPRARSVKVLAQAIGLAQDALRFALVGPEVRLGRALLEGAQRLLLGGEVKAAPRSRGRGRPDRGSWRGPWTTGCGSPSARRSAAGLQVLEQEWAQLDDPQRGLAASDYGVHAGTIPVVRALPQLPSQSSHAA